MIDDKKIEAAANKHIETEYARYNNGEVEEEMICLRGKDSFKEGAKWAINEFLKDLWHPASEKPADNEDILVESTFGSTSYELSLGMYYCIDECDEYHGDSWEVQAAKQRVTRWLYVDDLLPKEGGSNERT